MIQLPISKQRNREVYGGLKGTLCLCEAIIRGSYSGIGLNSYSSYVRLPAALEVQ